MPTRRDFVRSAMAVAAAGAPGAVLQAQVPANRVSGYDHVAMPMLNTDASSYISDPDGNLLEFMIYG